MEDVVEGNQQSSQVTSISKFPVMAPRTTPPIEITPKTPPTTMWNAFGSSANVNDGVCVDSVSCVGLSHLTGRAPPDCLLDRLRSHSHTRSERPGIE